VLAHSSFVAAEGSDDAPASQFVPAAVQKILKRSCLKCHGVSKSEGRLQLHSGIRISSGGESGAVVVASNPDESLLWQRVAQNEMPPDEPLDSVEKDILREWIASGATGIPRSDEEADQMRQDEHWAFRTIHIPALPQVKGADLCRTPVDQILQAELEGAGLKLGPDADRHTLLRRVSFSLTGLPPSPDEISQFLGDESPAAVEQMIDRFLASPQYGIRWGRYWLDAAGYADSNGYFNADSDRPLAFQYRDYVVRSINADRPFDLFIQEQIAGDELSGFNPDRHRRDASPEMIDMLIATHYLRNGQDGTGESDGNADEVRIDRYTALESAQQIIASSLLGLTLQCAKCHDHKFEPLSQHDFYRFQSVLFPAFNPDRWIKPNDRHTYASLPGEYEHWRAELDTAENRVIELQAGYRDWIQKNRVPESVLFSDDFTQADQLSKQWSATITGDDSPAGTVAVILRTSETDAPQALPAALISDGNLKIIEGGDSGDKWLSTRQTFDWTPDTQGDWIQVTFDLVSNRVHANEAPAARIAFGIALHDYNNSSPVEGGNILVDGNPDGGALVHLDYPGSTTKQLGKIGKAGYSPNHSYGVRVTRLPKGTYRLEQFVDQLLDGPHIDLKERDLPNGSFGFEFCCGRSFQVDNVVVETSKPAASTDEQKASYQTHVEELKRWQEEIQAARKRQAELQGNEPGRIAWLTDAAREPPDVFLLERGDYSQPTEKVHPAPFAALQDDFNPMQIDEAAPFASSGRRSAWAKWITRRGSRAAHLMARVQVNRVWQYHFGTGLVSTPENLGMSGAEPSNGLLLDWLANEFIRSGWSLKSLHRVILLSTAFRQSSLADERGLTEDPYNHLYWRYPMRR
jgi:hypothetical protein